MRQLSTASSGNSPLSTSRPFSSVPIQCASDGAFRIDHLAGGQVSLSREGTALGQPVTVTKTIRLNGSRLRPELAIEVEVHHRGHAPIETRLGLELSLHLLGGGGNPSAWYDVRGERTAHDGTGTAEGIDAIGYGNDWVGVVVAATIGSMFFVARSLLPFMSNSTSAV